MAEVVVAQECIILTPDTKDRVFLDKEILGEETVDILVSTMDAEVVEVELVDQALLEILAQEERGELVVYLQLQDLLFIMQEAVVEQAGPGALVVLLQEVLEAGEAGAGKILQPVAQELQIRAEEQDLEAILAIPEDLA